MSVPNLDNTSKIQPLPGTVMSRWPDGRMAKQANCPLRACKTLGEHKIFVYGLEKKKYHLQAHKGDVHPLTEEI